jgi:HAD superfamily hydrolase (TIGR01509 family)
MANDTAVLFDVDGTLVDSNYLHVFAWSQAFTAVGRPVDAVAIHRSVGMGSSQLLDRLLGPEDARRLGDRAKAEHTERYRQTYSLLRPFDGAVDLVRAVAKRSAVVLATSAQPEELEQLRRVLDVDDAVLAITSAADVDQAKPEPDLVAAALHQAGVPAERAIFVGDTVWDVQAAARAGLACVTVLTGGIGRAELHDAGAAAIYRSPAELLGTLDDSPLAPLFPG